jgi:hypothetical protein
MIRISRNTDLINIYDFILDVVMAIGIGSNTDKCAIPVGRNVTQREKQREQNHSINLLKKKRKLPYIRHQSVNTFHHG